MSIICKCIHKTNFGIQIEGNPCNLKIRCCFLGISKNVKISILNLRRLIIQCFFNSTTMKTAMCTYCFFRYKTGTIFPCNTLTVCSIWKALQLIDPTVLISEANTYYTSNNVSCSAYIKREDNFY